MEKAFLGEALFSGQTGNAFKLGTVLTLGWFWTRPEGCCLLYRGPKMTEVDFSNILTAFDIEASEIQPPDYLTHAGNTNCFYVLRRANCCGDLEHTLAASAKVAIDESGDLVVPAPNSIFAAMLERTEEAKVRFIWFYCSLGQKKQPDKFRVYFDDSTGQIDYENPISTIDYSGRRFYSYLSDTLETGEYLFAIKAEDSDGAEDTSLAKFKIHIGISDTEPITILNTELI